MDKILTLVFIIDCLENIRLLHQNTWLAVTMTQTRKPQAHANIPPIPAKTFKCISCNRSTFKSAQDLQQHRQSAHIPVQCQVCKRKFVDITALSQHKSMHQQCSVKSQAKQEQPVISKATPVVDTAAQPSSSNQQFPSVVEGVNYLVDGMVPFNLNFDIRMIYWYHL